MTLFIIGLALLAAGFAGEERERRRAWPLPVAGFASLLPDYLITTGIVLTAAGSAYIADALGIELFDDQEQQ